MLMAPTSKLCFPFFFLNDPATPEISPLPLPDALPICSQKRVLPRPAAFAAAATEGKATAGVVSLCMAPPPALGGLGQQLARLVGEPLVHARAEPRSEEHTSELQSQSNLVCRLLLGKKK